MLVAIITVLAIFIFTQFILSISYWDMKRKRKVYIRERFGSIPKAREWNENRRNYCDMFPDDISVDDITWNDLSMDQVFDRINQCDTSAGEEILYWRLRRNRMDTDERALFEKRVEAFDRDERLRESVEDLLCDMGKSSASYYIPSYMDSIEEYRMKNAWVYRLMQVLLVAAAAAALVMRSDTAMILPAAVCVVNLLLYMILKMKYELELSLSGPAVRLLEIGRKLAARKEIAELFPELGDKIKNFSGVIRRAQLLQGQKMNVNSGDPLGILGDYVLGITLWQITTYNKVMSLLKEHDREYLEVYRIIGEIDAAVCTASFRRSLPWYCTPEECEENQIIMEDIYHPLLSNPVENSLSLDRGCLITGSNASGKSTFIKAAAVNAILGQALNTCAARGMRMPRMQVLTSMAVKDDLMEGESYFIREIRYLKRILDSLSDERMTFCAVDEILRGTNTGERIRASRAILEYIADKNCIALVASHDKELTELLKDSYINCHFSEEMGENDISFSYKLMKGPATSQNAIALLRLAGFPAEIMEAAGE